MLQRLRFYGTVRSNIFGLGMVLIGFCVCAYIALLLSAISYMPLGHVGRVIKKKGEVPEIQRTPSMDQRTVGADQSVDVAQRKDV